MNTKQEKRQILNRQSNKFQSTTHFATDKNTRTVVLGLLGCLVVERTHLVSGPLGKKKNTPT